MFRRFNKFRSHSRQLFFNEGFSRLITSVALAATVSVLPVQAQNITIDGNTNTILSKNANVTNVSTSTILNSTAFNSFKTFNIPKNDIVNLLLPGSTSTLVNLIKEGPSNINGTLNSLMNGKPGGNIFLVNPYGVIVGNTGMVNVGSLVVATPSTDFVNTFFDAPGVINIQSLEALENGTYSVNSAASFENYGVIQALDSIEIKAGSVVNEGQITTGYTSDNKVDFEDLINTDDLEDAGYLVAEDTFISIQADNDITNAGQIAAYGLNNSQKNLVHLQAKDNINLLNSSEISSKGLKEDSSGGEVRIFASRDTVFEQESTIDVSSGKNSGDAGFIELSAADTVYSYGQFKASSENGKAGTIFIDPDQVITNNVFTDGADYIVNADNLTIQGVTISTRDIADPVTGDHLYDPSEGDSGRLEFNVFNLITLQPDTEIFTFADNNFSSGVAEFIAQRVDMDQSILMTGDAVFRVDQLNMVNQSGINSTGNIIVSLSDNGDMTVTDGVFQAENGFVIDGQNADATLTDTSVFAMGQNGLDVDLYGFTINTANTDAIFMTPAGDIDINTIEFQVNPGADTDVSFISWQDVTFQGEDIYFSGDPTNNSTTTVNAGDDVTFKSVGIGATDVYSTQINAADGIAFDMPYGFVSVADSDLISNGPEGLDFTALSLYFVGYDSSATVRSEVSGIEIDSVQTGIQSDGGPVNIIVNGPQSDLNMTGAIFQAISYNNTLNVQVNDGDLNIDMTFGAMLDSYYGNDITLNASNDLNMNADLFSLYGPGIDLNAGNDINMTFGSSDLSGMQGAQIQAGNNFNINAQNSPVNIIDSQVQASNISINANMLLLVADTVDSYLQASDEYIAVQANTLLLDTTVADLSLNAQNGTVVLAAADMDLETPNAGNDIKITAQNAHILGDNILITDPTSSVDPGMTNINVTQDLLIDNRPAQTHEIVNAIVNPPITDAVTQSDAVNNYVRIKNAQIRANKAEFKANSNVQLENTLVEVMDGVFFELETPQGGANSAVVAVDSDIISRGAGGVNVDADAMLVYTEAKDVNITSQTSDVNIDSDFVNIFGNLAGSEVNISAGNNVLFVGDHINLGMNIINPFLTDYTIDIDASNSFVSYGPAGCNLMLNNVDLDTPFVHIFPTDGRVSIQDSDIATSNGMLIMAEELAVLSYFDDTSLTATIGAINLFADSNIFIIGDYQNSTVYLNSAQSILIDASDSGDPAETIVEIASADMDAGAALDIVASDFVYVYGESTLDANGPVGFIAQKVSLGLGSLPDDPAGVQIESPISLDIMTDELIVDPSQKTLVGANGSLLVTRQTYGDIYYGPAEPAGSVNITPQELNNMWSSFISFSAWPNFGNRINNVILDAPIGLPNGITMYSNDSITMNAGSSIGCFSTVMNSNTITIGDGVTVNSEIVDMTADNFNISEAAGTAVTGNSEVKIDRLTPGDFNIGPAGNLRGLNSVQAVSALSRKVSLGLSSDKLQNVAFAESINIPSEFQISAQGNVTDSLAANVPAITSEGLHISVNDVGTENAPLDFSLTSGVLNLDLTGNAYLNAPANDVSLTGQVQNIELAVTQSIVVNNFTTHDAEFLSGADQNIQAHIDGTIMLDAGGNLILNNASTTNLASVEANNVQITSQGSIQDLNTTNDPTITAQNIDLTSATGFIGTSGKPLAVFLNASRIDANSPGAINIKATSDFELGNVTSQNSDVRLESTGFITADNGVVRGNHISILADEIQVSDNTVVDGTGNVGFATDTFTLSTPDAPAIEADGAIILSRYSRGGMVIFENGIQNSNSRAPIHLDLDVFDADELIIGNNNQTNSLTDTIFINDQLIYDRNKLTLSANDLIYDRNDNLPSVVADNLTLISGRDIGLENNLFDANIENKLAAEAPGNIYIKDHNKNLVIDTIENSDGSLYISTENGNIYIDYISALKKIVISAGGQIVDIKELDPEDIVISVGDANGRISINDGSVSNSVDLKANELYANFTDTGSTGVSFDLSNINNTRANQVTLTANSSNGITLSRLFAVNSTVNNNLSGGGVTFNNTDISGALTVAADNISTTGQVSVQTASLTGINGQRANSIQFLTPESLKINTLRADTATIKSSGDILDITNAQVYNNGEFSNNTKLVIMDNLGTFKDFNSVDAIIFTRDIFDLYLDSSSNIKTTADVLFIRPDLTVNGTRSNDEVGKALALVTNQAYSYMDNSLNRNFNKDYTSDFFQQDYINVFAFVLANSYNEEQNLGITNYLLDKAITVYRGALLSQSEEPEALQMAVNVLVEANMTREVAQQLLKNPLYETKEDSQKILNFYITN